MQLFFSTSWITQGGCTHNITPPQPDAHLSLCYRLPSNLVEASGVFGREVIYLFLQPGAFDWFWSLLDCPSENNTHNCCGNVKQTDTSPRPACNLWGIEMSQMHLLLMCANCFFCFAYSCLSSRRVFNLCIFIVNPACRDCSLVWNPRYSQKVCLMLVRAFSTAVAKAPRYPPGPVFPSHQLFRTQIACIHHVCWGVMGLGNPRRLGHSGAQPPGTGDMLSPQIMVFWWYKRRGRGASRHWRLQRWERPCVQCVCSCVCGRRQTADNLWAGSQVTYFNLFCRRWTAEERCMKQSQIWKLVYDLEFPVGYITVYTNFFFLLSIMKLSFTVYKVGPLDCIKAD